MLRIECSGSPYEMGLKHGTEARAAISRTITFYTGLFQKNAKLDWPQVQQLAEQFKPNIHKNWPAYLEEMDGIATGAQQPLTSILALNVRTEIAFGLFSADACTSLAWQTPNATFLAQNWDWQAAQKPNLVHLTLRPQTLPAIQMITEAGLIGKIGLNAAGVGVCLNALKASGMDATRMPCHLGLRRALESATAAEAVAALTAAGVASACHMLVADAATGGVGVEFSAKGWRKISPSAAHPLTPPRTPPSQSSSQPSQPSQSSQSLQQSPGPGRVVHTNHYLLPPGADVEEDANWLPDTGFRARRMEELCAELEAGKAGENAAAGVRLADVQRLFRDEANAPGSICRAGKDGDGDAVVTVFNIVMDLRVPCAQVVVGRPVEPEEVFEMVF